MGLTDTSGKWTYVSLDTVRAGKVPKSVTRTAPAQQVVTALRLVPVDAATNATCDLSRDLWTRGVAVVGARAL